MASEFVKDLVQHKAWVAENLHIAAGDLFRRAALHDNSKFSPEEFDVYDQAFADLQRYAYGTPELQAVYARIRPALDHHFQVNRHHPEYHEQGVSGMNLLDVLEMVCDWMAASKRSQTGITKGLDINKERYAISDQLFEIIKNTVAFIQAEKE